MYKEVWKRLLAVVLSVCMVLGMTDFSTLVARAENSTNYKITNVRVLNQLEYNGEKQYPKVQIDNDSIILKEGTDYKIDWPKESTNVGEYSAKVTGLGNYAGETKEITYSISRKLIGRGTQLGSGIEVVVGKVTVDGDKAVAPKEEDGNLNVTYNEKPLKGIYIEAAQDNDEAEKLFGEMSDTSSYEYYYYCSGNDKGATTNAKLIFFGCNSYYGKCEQSYSISNKSLEDTDITVNKEVEYTGNLEKYETTISIKEKNGNYILVEKKDYTLAYKGDTSRPGKIEVEITGIGDYLGSSATAEYVIIKNMVDFAEEFEIKPIAEKTYTGTTITLEDGEIVVKDNGVILTKDKHYTIVPGSNNTNVTQGATVYIKGNREYGYTGQLIAMFDIKPRSITDKGITISGIKDCDYNTKEQTPEITVTYNGQTIDSSNYEVKYENNKDVGLAIVTIKGQGNLEGTTTKNFSINKIWLSTNEDISIELDKQDYDYSSETPVEPKVTVKYDLGEGEIYTLKEGTDYTVSYSNNTSAGKGKVVVNGKGNFVSNKSVEYTINAVGLTDESTTVRGINDSYVYTGAEITPSGMVVSYKDSSGAHTLKRNTDYTVAYSNNTNVGTATITITGTGNYFGSISKTFTITTGDIKADTVSVSLGGLTNGTIAFAYNKPEPTVTVTHEVDGKSYTLTKENYEVSYSYENTDASESYATVGKAWVTIKGKSNFMGERTVEFEITPMVLGDNANKITLEGLQKFYTYYGEPIDPSKNSSGGLSVIYDERNPLDQADYTMTFADNNKPGAGTIIITAKENTNFTGSVEKEFTIKGRLDHEKTEISDIEKQVYTGKPILLTGDELTVHYSYTNTDLKYGTDFSLESYTDNTEPGSGTAKVNLIAMGNYYISVSGETIPLTFTILPKDLDDETIDGKEDPIKLQIADIPNQVYTGSPIYPTLNITYNGYTLVEGTDYEVVKDEDAAANCTVSGAASITIKGKGSHFTGTRTIDFTIEKRKLTSDTIKVDNIDDVRYYKKEAVTIEEPTFTYISADGKVELKSDGDILKGTYDISYRDNDKVGTAYLVITPKEDSNFIGEVDGKVEIPFILKGDLSDGKHTYIYVATDKVFTGYEQTLTADDIWVSYCEQMLTLGTDFKINYKEGTNVNASDSVPFTIEGISTYYVNTNTSDKNTFVIKPKDIAEKGVEVKEIAVAGINEDGYTYTGEEICPYKMEGFGITYKAAAGSGAISLTEYDAETETGDYNIALRGDTINATEEDKPYIEVKAVEGGNYTGTLKIEYTITPQSVDIKEIVAKNQILSMDEATGDITVEKEEAIEGLKVTCDGKLVTFENLVVYWTKDGAEPIILTRDKDYKVSYERRTSKEEGKEEEELCFGETKLVIEGLGNYKDTKTVAFMVEGDLTDSEHVTVMDIKDQPYTAGNGVKPEVEVYYYQQLLEKEVDYKLEWENITEVAAADAENAPAVIIKGKGAFEESSTKKTFSIIPRDLAINDGVMKLEGLEKDGYPYTGKEVCPSGLKLYNNGYPVNQSDYTISYKNNVNGGKATDPNPPCVVITAKEGGNYTGSMEVPFTIVGIPLSDKTVIEIDSVGAQVYTGSELQPKVTVKHLGNTLVEGTHYTLSWKNNVDVTASTASEAPTVIIEGIGNYSATVEVKFNIVPRNIKDYESEFTISIAPQTYSGEAFVPDPVVKNAADQVLEKDKDYTVSAGTNNVDAGTEATITITGIGNYTGTITPQFTINPQPISNEEEFVISGIVDKVYNSKEQTQQPTITWMEKKTTDDVTDEPVDDGTDNPADDAADDSQDDVTDGSEEDDSPAPQVKRELTTDDYTITYTNHVNAGTAMAVITGTGNYTGSRTVYFKIAQRSLSDNGIMVKDIVNQVYTGSELTPDPEIYYQDAELGINTKLVSGTDYTITYSNNNKVGANIATVKITGKGNYSGTTSTTFTIVGNIALANVSSIGVQNYTGKAIEPKPTVTQAGKTLVEGTDYSLSYSNNVEAGTATIIIKGINEYGGTKKVTFAICRDISAGIAVVGLGEKYLYTGSAIVPTLGKVSAYGKVLTLNKDYIVTVTNNINVGTATLKVEGIGIYKGVKTFNFDIVRRSVSQCSVSSISTKTYTGKALTPAITVSYNKKTLTPGTDYTLVYQNNTLPGTASIIIKGKGNLSGSKIVTFKIKMANISKAKAKTVDTDKIKVSWKKQSTVTGYQIYNNKNKKVAQIKGNSNTSYTITGLKAGTTYKYKVRAYVIKNGRTCYSAFTSLMTVSTKPKAPSITVKSSKSKQAVISWKKVSGASGYEIYRSTKKSSGYKKLTTTTKLTYTNKKLTANKKYYYKVRAYRTVDGKKIYSSYSSVKYVTIKK